MGVVPICTGLVMCVELMQEASTRFDGALGYAKNTVGPVGHFLEYTMPMLLGNQHRAIFKVFDTDHTRGSLH